MIVINPQYSKFLGAAGNNETDRNENDAITGCLFHDVETESHIASAWCGSVSGRPFRLMQDAIGRNRSPPDIREERSGRLRRSRRSPVDA